MYQRSRENSTGAANTVPSPGSVHKEKGESTPPVSLAASGSTALASSGSSSLNAQQAPNSSNQPNVYVSFYSLELLTLSSNINAFLGHLSGLRFAMNTTFLILSSKNQELAPPIDSVAYADELVKEYLLFRGIIMLEYSHCQRIYTNFQNIQRRKEERQSERIPGWFYF